MKITMNLTESQAKVLDYLIYVGETAAIAATLDGTGVDQFKEVAAIAKWDLQQALNHAQPLKLIPKAKPRKSTSRFEGELLPRIWGGCDWGVQAFVVCRKGDKILFWMKGHSSYLDRGAGTVYQSGQLQLNKGDGYNVTTLHEGGRLTDELIHQHIAQIEEFFGESDLSTRLSVKTTLNLDKANQ